MPREYFGCWNPICGDWRNTGTAFGKASIDSKHSDRTRKARFKRGQGPIRLQSAPKFTRCSHRRKDMRRGSEVESWRSARGETSARQSRPQRRIDHWRPYLSPGCCASPNLPRMKKRLSSGGDGWLKPQGPAPRERLPVLVLHYVAGFRLVDGPWWGKRRVTPDLAKFNSSGSGSKISSIRRGSSSVSHISRADAARYKAACYKNGGCRNMELLSVADAAQPIVDRWLVSRAKFSPIAVVIVRCGDETERDLAAGGVIVHVIRHESPINHPHRESNREHKPSRSRKLGKTGKTLPLIRFYRERCKFVGV
jgi:hypothetical protein